MIDLEYCQINQDNYLHFPRIICYFLALSHSRVSGYKDEYLPAQAFAPLPAALALPACAELPGLPPSGRAVETVVTDESLFQAAEADYHRQAYGRAYQSYAQYLERYPQGPHAAEARLREAELLGLRGDWQGSLGLYQGILARQPEPGVALKARYGIGRAYFKLGQYQQAAQTLDSLTAVGDLPHSLWFSTQALLAEIALKQGNIPDAYSRLRLAAQDLPSGDQEWFRDPKTRVVGKRPAPRTWRAWPTCIGTAP